MKKILALLLAMMMVFALAACGGNEENPSGSGSNTQGSSEQQDQTSEVDENDASSQPDESDNVNSLEYLAEMEGLPGLTAPAGAVYEQGFMGIVFSKEGGFSKEDKMAYIRSVWDLCKELSPNGIYNNDKLETKYTEITDKYPEFEEGTFESFQVGWVFVHGGKIWSANITGSETIEVYGASLGSVE